MGKLRDRPAGLRDRGGKVVLSPHSRLLVTTRRKIFHPVFSLFTDLEKMWRVRFGFLFLTLFGNVHFSGKHHSKISDGTVL